MRRRIADIITGCRIVCSVLMAFLPAFSAGFYAAYLLCGLSDIADGVAARKTNSASVSGARVDTAADLIFAAVSMAKLVVCGNAGPIREGAARRCFPGW